MNNEDDAVFFVLFASRARAPYLAPLCVERNLVQKIVPGTRVKVMGVYSLRSGGGGKPERGGGGTAIQQPYIKAGGWRLKAETRGY